MLMSDMNSSSTSDDWSRDSIVASWAALDDRSAVAVVAALVGVAEVLVGRVAVGDWWVEASGWSGVDWTGVGVAGGCEDDDTTSLAVADDWPSRCARALRRLAMYRFFSSGVFFTHFTFFSM